MFRPTIALFAAVAALALIAGGCGGGYGSDEGGGPKAAPPRTAYSAPVMAAPVPAEALRAQPAAAGAAAGPIAVAVEDNVFDPETLHAKVGQKITWTLKGDVAHTVSATQGAKFESGPLNPGQSFSYTTKQAGTITYLCRFHQGMEGTIVVE